MNLKNKIINILGESDTLEFRISGDTFLITYGNMYSSPSLGLEKLMKLSELFGTVKIDVDDYAQEGCESCDYGSDYGHKISIEEAVKEVSTFNKLVKE